MLARLTALAALVVGVTSVLPPAQGRRTSAGPASLAAPRVAAMADGDPAARKAAPLGRVRVSPDGRGFVLVPSGRVFHPWGVNYGNHGRLIEDYWSTDWRTVHEDFLKIKALGYNVVRIHLQFGKFMDSPTAPNGKSMALLVRLVKLAERQRLYLDLTGLACYRKSDVPAWYDALTDEERWAAQAAFWQAVAGRCAPYSSIFCYDLMNEPLAPGGDRGPGKWYSGSSLGGYDFLQFIALHQGKEPREEMPPRWIREMTRAIRTRDHQTLITVGLLPWTPQLGFLSGFVPRKIAPEVDFVSVHIYPEAGKVPEALDVLHRFAVGKPLVIEETFPLSCSADDLESFLLQSRKDATGWLGHYNGMSIAEYEKERLSHTLSVSDAIWESWLQLSVKLKPDLVRP